LYSSCIPFVFDATLDFALEDVVWNGLFALSGDFARLGIAGGGQAE
jgi:hypothetical protein